MPQPIYLDYNASTPIAPEVLKVLSRVFGEVHGNALSMHAFGVAARRRGRSSKTPAPRSQP